MAPRDPGDPAAVDMDPGGLPAPPQAEVVVDLAAIRHNIRRLGEIVSEGLPAGRPEPQLMVVVKADGYGHGMEQVARTARTAGVPWLGVATGPEALALRKSGDTGRLLCWLAAPGTDFTPLLEADVDVTAYTPAQLEEILRAARRQPGPARVQLKFDTGLSRGGAARDEWLPLLTAARAAELEGSVQVTGLWSHLACADQPDHPANLAQERAFDEVCALAADTGLDPEVRHLANSAGAVLRPTVRHDLVRLGIAVYGLTPAPDVASSADLGLRPAMTVTARVVMTRELDAGAGVSYGHRFVAPEPMRVALVPLGYGDGVPRHASSRAEVLLDGARQPVLGTVCMDQFVVAGPDARPGDAVTLFGSGQLGEPTAQEWADWCDTISYEIVTRMRGRQQRRWVDEGRR